MIKSIDELALPVGHVISGERENGDTFWLGRFTDGSICGIVANPYYDQNSVDIATLAGGPSPEIPTGSRQMTVMYLQVLMLRATMQGQSPFGEEQS